MVLFAINIVQEDVEQFVAGRTMSSGSNRYVQAGSVHLSREAAVSVKMLSKEPEVLSTG